MNASLTQWRIDLWDIMGTRSIKGYTFTHTYKHTHIHFSTSVSVPVLPHPLINISAISIIDRWILRTQMYQNHSDFFFARIEASIFHSLPVCWKAERLKRPTVFCSALLLYWAVEMKNIHPCLSPGPCHFFSYTEIPVWYMGCLLVASAFTLPPGHALLSATFPQRLSTLPLSFSLTSLHPFRACFQKD